MYAAYRICTLLPTNLKANPMLSRRFASPLALLLAALAIAAPAPRATAQTAAKKALTVDDYAKWRSINTSSISGDGKWVTYVLALTNTLPAESKPVMHLLRL